VIINDQTNAGRINIRPEPSFNEGTFPKTTANKSYPILASQFTLEYTWYQIWADEIPVTGWVRGDLVTLSGNCDSFPPTPTPSGILPTPIGTPAATVVPPCKVAILLGGSTGLNFERSNTTSNLAVWATQMRGFGTLIEVPYRGITENSPSASTTSARVKLEQLNEALNIVKQETYRTCDLIIVGYSAGADAATWFADQYIRERSNGNVTGNIIGIALLGATCEIVGCPVTTITPVPYVHTYQAENMLALFTTLGNAGTKIYILDDGYTTIENIPCGNACIDNFWGEVTNLPNVIYVSEPNKNHFGDTNEDEDLAESVINMFTQP
jgi:hypothetical protein